MIIGDRKSIAFEYVGRKPSFIIMNIIIDSKNMSHQDNSYYVYPLINNIEKEIQFLENNELLLNEELIGKPLPILNDIFYNTEKGLYEDEIERMDFLYYDLSTKRAFIYAYQEKDDLIFFGKLFHTDTNIQARIKKHEFVKILKRLLKKVKSEKI